MTMLENELPDDVLALRNLVIDQNKLILDLTDRLAAAEEKIRAWEIRYYGKKSEKLKEEDERQGRLFDEAEFYAEEPAPPAEEKVLVPAHTRKKGGRRPKNTKLPVVEVVHELASEDKTCPCCGESRPEIGQERSSEYDVVPSYVRLLTHVRKKYGPCACQGFDESGEKSVIIAPGPVKIVKGSDFSNRTIALFVVGKFTDALPYYRLSRILTRFGLEVGRATLCKLAVSVGHAIGPLIDRMIRDMMASPVVLMDETPLTVLEQVTGKDPPRKKCYMWVQRGYWQGKPIHRFAYHESRSGSFADSLLEGFSGYLQTDGYAGYTHFEAKAGIRAVGCFAHMRRKFVEAWEVAQRTGVAKEAIDIIARLYAEEASLRRKLERGAIDEDAFVATRAARVSLILSELRAWLFETAKKVAPSSQLGRAVDYAIKVFDRAARFVEHPLLRPDTNLVENAIRPFVVGRKNWLFSGSERGAHASAGLYSLIETAKVNGHEPLRYLSYVFDRLPLCKSDSDIEALLPYRIDPSTIPETWGN